MLVLQRNRTKRIYISAGIDIDRPVHPSIHPLIIYVFNDVDLKELIYGIVGDGKSWICRVSGRLETEVKGDGAMPSVKAGNQADCVGCGGRTSSLRNLSLL